MIVRRVLPWVLALAIVAAFMLSACSALSSAAQLAGSGAAWAQGVQASTHAPGPAGPAITVTIAPCPGLEAVAAGCSMPWSSTIYVDPADRWPDVLEHELGLFFGDRDLDATERAYVVALMGYPAGTPWDPGPARWAPTTDVYCRRVACPDERFADAYAVCALGYRTITHGRTYFGTAFEYAPTRAQHHQMCTAIRAFA